MAVVAGTEPYQPELAEACRLLAEMTDEGYRSMVDDGFEAVRAREVIVPVPGVEVRALRCGDHVALARIVRPAQAARGVYVSVHGGGWCTGSAASGDVANRQLADELGVVVVAPSYRLAPEHPHPAAADDVHAVLAWVLEHAPDEWGTELVAVGGESAGAHLALLAALRCGDAGSDEPAATRARLVGANLVSGVFDLAMTPSQRAAEHGLGIPTRVLALLYDAYLPGVGDDGRRAGEISPLYAPPAALAALPAALVSVGGAEPVLDDSLFLAARWRAAGGRVDLDVYPGAPHGFSVMPIGLGDLARRRIARWLDRRFDG